MNIRRLLGLCEHEWSIIRWCYIVDEEGDTVGTKNTVQCDKCGNLKVIKI